jgi:hypothetical protein
MKRGLTKMFFLTEAIKDYYWRKHRAVWSSYKTFQGIEEMVAIYSRIFKGRLPSLTKAELFFVFTMVRKLRRLKGCIAEVGVFEGNTAKLIAEIEKEKEIHLFDTFEGFPYTDKFYTKGGSKADLGEIKRRFADNKNVFFHKGVFPKETAGAVKNKRFSLVHLDADLFLSTYQSLQFFYQRMVVGGVMVFHDYYHLPAVTRAVDKFFANKPEMVLRSTVGQAFVQKLGK